MFFLSLATEWEEALGTDSELLLAAHCGQHYGPSGSKKQKSLDSLRAL